jgi:PadR family transcriptional regulator, regulatory protein AphA
MSTDLRSRQLTTTSYAILGLLAVRPWTTYELAQQMERTLNRIWPRARSKLYEEPKKLVAHGMATAATESTGRRQRTVYTITARGREELAEWLSVPGAGPALEFEGLLKLFFADHGTRADALATIDAIDAWATEQLAVFASAAEEYVAGHGPFPERMAVNALGAGLLVDVYATTRRWATWARGFVARWPDDPARARVDIDEFVEIVRPT